MRVLITGGSGFIGRALAASLTADKNEVIVLSRAARPLRPLPAGVRHVPWDGRSSADWGPLADGAQALVNLAGESIGGAGFLDMRWTKERKQRILESRLNAGDALVQAVTQAKVKPAVVVQISAVGFYGPQQDERLEESAPPGNDFLARVCQDWEASTFPVEALGVRRVVLRQGLVLDTHGGLLPRQMLPFRLFAGGPVGSGRQGYSWVHLSDVVRAIRFLINNDAASGIFNLAAPNPLSNRDFGRALAKALHRPYWLPVPAFALRLLFGEAASLILDGQFVLPRRLLDMGFKFQYHGVALALEELFR